MVAYSVSQTDRAWEGRQTQLPIERHDSPCRSGWGDILCCWLDSRYRSMGLCDNMVRHCCRYDSHDLPVSVQYGLVGFYIPCR